MHSGFFYSETMNPSGERDFLPHTILKMGLYAYCSEQMGYVDSTFFYIDLTRNRMNYYPFININFDTGGTKSHLNYDVTVQSRMNWTSDYSEGSNNLGTINYWPLNTDLNDYCEYNTYLPEPFDSSANPDNYIHPSPYSLATWDMLNHSGSIPAGYVKEEDSLVYQGGIKHTYIVDTFIDLTTINSSDRTIFNPSETIIEADSMVFPSGYTFRTVRGLYPSKEEIDNSPICEDEDDPYKKLVPTDLDTSKYNIEGTLYIQPCTYIYDAKFIVDTGGKLYYTPDYTYGNFTIEDNGGQIIEEESETTYCNNCGCVKEYYGDGIGNIAIDSSQTWTGDKVINGVVTVKTGKTLTINNSNLYFTDSLRIGRNTGILVERGAKLKIDNSTLTVLDCDKMWDGIEVWGNPAYGQDTIYQGKLEISNSTISHARTGILAGSAIRCGDTKMGGAIIEATNTEFKDNHIAVRFRDYKGTRADFDNSSVFDNCTFSSTQNLLDWESYPGKGTHRFVQLNNISGIDFKNNRFECTNPDLEYDSLKPTGIVAYDGYFKMVDDDEAEETGFFNLYKGIDAYRTAIYFKRMILKRVLFDSLNMAVTVNGGGYDFIDSCHFKDVLPNIWYDGFEANPYKSKAGWGMYLLDNKYSMIINNRFDQSLDNTSFDIGYGLIVNNGFSGTVLYNRYDTLDYNMQTEYNNNRLMIGCNDFYTGDRISLSANPVQDLYGHSGLAPNLLADQGIGCDFQEPTAGNRFYLQCNFNEVIKAELVSFSYYGHGFHGDASVPDTNCSSTAKVDINACTRSGQEQDWYPEVYGPINDTTTTGNNTGGGLGGIINDMTDTLTMQRKFGEFMGMLIDDRDAAKAKGMMNAVDFMDTRKLKVPVHLATGDYTDADDLVDSIYNSDQTANLSFKNFFDIQVEHLKLERRPCSYTAQEVIHLDSVAFTGKEMTINSEAAMAAYQDTAYTPIPLQWADSSGKKGSKNIIADEGGVKLYPNPASTYLTIEISWKGNSQFKIYSIEGKLKIEGDLKYGTNNIDTRTLPPGYYITEISNKNKQKNEYQKVIISR